MADPLSSIASVIGITATVIQLSKAFVELANDIRGGPEEIKSISRDVHAFCSIIFSLNATLKEEDIQNAINGDEAMAKMIQNLTDPLKNCQAVLGELMVKIQKLAVPRLEGTGFRMNSTSVKWGLFNKSELRDLQLRLEAAKSTLGRALEAVTTLCGVRLLAVGKAAAAQSATCSSRPADTSFAFRRLSEGSIGAKSETQPSPRASHSYSVPQQVTNDEQIFVPRKQVLDSLTSFVSETQHTFMSEDGWAHRHLAQIYRELGEQRMLIRQLKLAIEQPREPKDEQTMPASNCSMHVPGKLVDPVLEGDIVEDSDSTAVDIFFDCVSRFSTDDCSSSIDRLHANFSGSPDYWFELAPSFYLEQYMAAGLFSERVFVNAIIRSQDGHRTVKYFITYAETPRRWLRIIVLATFSQVQEQSTTLQVWVPDNNDCNCKLLPKALQSLLKTEIPRLELFDSVTSLSMSLKEEESGQIVTNTSRIEVVEDDLETEMSNEDQILQDIEDLGCAKILESDVVVISRITSSRYKALVKSQMCVEQKVPFASAGNQGDNGYRDFVNDLKLLNSLRGCPGVVQFIGVVLDERRRHLRSYLHESPRISSIHKLFNIMLSKSETIPWPIRELWASQLIKAVSDIHKKGKIVGVFKLNAIGVRADGTAVFSSLRTSQRHMEDAQGEMPPELRHSFNSDDRILQKTMNFRTDIF